MTRAMRSQDDARPDREARREQGGRPASWGFVPAGARDKTGCARCPFSCRGTGNAGSREARRKPSAADPTSSRGGKIRNTITSAGGESLDTLGGNYAGRRLIFANGPLKARETVSQREQHKAGRTDCALSGCNTRSVATPTAQP